MRTVLSTSIPLVLTVVVYVLLFTHSTAAFGADADFVADEIASELWERYQEEAPQTAAKLQDATLRLVCELNKEPLTSSKSARSVEQLGSGEQFELTLWQGLMKKTDVESRGRGVQSIMVMNGEYAFEINKSPQRDQYAINWLEEIGGWTLAARFVESQRNEVLAGPFGYWYLFGIPFFELATNPSCRVTRVSRELRETRTLLRVDFETQRDGWDPAENYALMDPEQGWAPVESGSVYQAHKEHRDWKSEYTGSIAFGDSIDGLPIVAQKTETWRSKNWAFGDPDSELVQQSITTVRILPVEDISVEEFYLSHYGLPEPNFGLRWFRSLWTYLFGAVACLAVAYGLRRRRRAVA